MELLVQICDLASPLNSFKTQSVKSKPFLVKNGHTFFCSPTVLLKKKLCLKTYSFILTMKLNLVWWELKYAHSDLKIYLAISLKKISQKQTQIFNFGATKKRTERSGLDLPKLHNPTQSYLFKNDYLYNAFCCVLSAWAVRTRAPVRDVLMSTFVRRRKRYICLLVMNWCIKDMFTNLTFIQSWVSTL